MDLKIRKVKLEDAYKIMSLTEELGYQLTIEEIKDKLKRFALSPDQMVFVAVGDDIIGWIHITLTEPLESKLFGEIRGIVVKEEFRGQSVGKKLIQTAEQWIRGKGVRLLRVRTNITRINTREYYRKLGFIPQKNQEVFEKEII